jgi:hypothetical protein
MANSKLIQTLDLVFGQYIKLRDTDDSGHGYDFVTGERLTYSTCEASHFVKRDHLYTRWDETNVVLQLPENNQDNERSTIAEENFRNQIKEAYGQGALIRLEKAKNLHWKPWDFELKKYIAEYRALNKKLAQRKDFPVNLN